MDIIALRTFANALINSVQESNSPADVSIPDERLSTLSRPTCLETLLETIGDSLPKCDHRTHKLLVLLEGSFRNPKGIEVGLSAEDQAVKLAEWATKAILPPQDLIVNTYHVSDNNENEARDKTVHEFKVTSIVALRFLSLLYDHFPIILRRPSSGLITSLASYTDQRDEWVGQESVKVAGQLLAAFTSYDTRLARNVMIELLRTRVLSAFQASRSAKITQAGHKAITPIGEAYSFHGDEAKIKAWKYKQTYITSVLRWILKHLDAPNMEAQWAFIIPPILTLIDDESVHYKIRGCEMLQAVLRTIPSALLERTGLGNVFTEALIPCLSYLPTMTPEQDSVALLGSVFPTLSALARCQYPESGQRRNRNVLLDKILRAGVFNGLAHAGEYVSIAILLVGQLSEIVNEMGVWSVRHLKHTIPFLIGYFSDVFSSASAPLVHAVCSATRTVILNGWPCMNRYAGEMFKGIALCWQTLVNDLDAERVKPIRVDLAITLQLLLSSLDPNSKNVQDIKSTVFEDKILEGLLQ